MIDHLSMIEDQIKLCKAFPRFIDHIIGFHTTELLNQRRIPSFFKKLVVSFKYDYSTSKKTCLAIIRALPKRDKTIVKELFNFLEKLNRETTNEPIKYRLSQVINCLMKKLGEY